MPWGVIAGLIVIALLCMAWPLLRRARQVPPALAPVPAPATPRPPPVAAAAPGAQAADAQASAEALSADEIRRRLAELALATEPLRPAPAEDLQALLTAQRTLLETVATQPRYAPRRPLLLPQLLKAVNDDETSRHELAVIIARDPALTGSLLNLANSAFYRVTDRPVESIDRAVALLGTNGLRSLVAAALAQPVFRLTEKQFSRFPEIAWAHTYRCAAAAEAHAAIVEDSDPFAGQLLGLVFGLGTIVTFRVALDYYSARPSLKPDPAVIAAFLEAQSAAVAQRIAASWELSGRILNALADQIPGVGMREPTALGRSLSFGRLIAALAVLESHQRISDAAAKASILASGATPFQFERLWGRLTGKQDTAPPREQRRTGLPRRY
ncbi:MAG TPA: HDOD domain-containing protein [Steroidobacteraceae bacterium]|nr:HDOD domain-containing protein [Steroidobacteraceae bacterium]